MQRLPDWPARFAELVGRSRARPFAWGRHDCVLWGADVVSALTGIDCAADYRGSYSSALGAARLVESLGGLRTLVTSRLGPPVPGCFARVGDIGLLTEGERELLGACNGAHWLAPAASGLAVLELHRGALAWRVGE